MWYLFFQPEWFRWYESQQISLYCKSVCRDLRVWGRYLEGGRKLLRRSGWPHKSSRLLDLQ